MFFLNALIFMLQRYVIKHNYATHFKFFFQKKVKKVRGLPFFSRLEFKIGTTVASLMRRADL